VLYELIVMHIQTEDRTLHLGRDSDEVGEDVGIARSRIVVGALDHHQPQRQGDLLFEIDARLYRYALESHVRPGDARTRGNWKAPQG
jgi:hypothetical protein